MSKVIRIEKRHPETALENLNRLTGLDFQSWPESLIDNGDATVRAQDSEDTDRRPAAPQRVSRQG